MSWREEAGRVLCTSSRWFGEDKSNLEKTIKNFNSVVAVSEEQDFPPKQKSREMLSWLALYLDSKHTNCNYLEVINN